VIRVIYRWKVQPGTEGDFLAWWHDGTTSIRSSHDGEEIDDLTVHG
jgi:hypothetical protein